MSHKIQTTMSGEDALQRKHLEVLRKWPKELESALQAAVSEGCPADSVSGRDVAWAISWLLEESVREDSPMKTNLAHLRTAAANGDWNGLKAILTRALGQSKHYPRNTMPMQELAWSVGCERRLDWRPPPPPPPPPEEGGATGSLCHESIRVDASNLTYTALNGLEGEVVERGCRKWARRDPHDLADRAWAAAYTTYWSAEASRRWAGNARVSTLILGVAKKLALSDYARRGLTSVDSDTYDFRQSSHKSNANGLLENIEGDVERTATPMQKEILRLLVERGLSQQQVAQHLEVSEAAVSQTLTRLAKRLGRFGYGGPKGRRGKA